MATIHLNRITIYPIKSLDGLDVQEANVLPSGALEYDRRLALVDADGRFVNGKRTAAFHRIRAEYDLARMAVRLRDTARDTTAAFSLVDDVAEIGRWLTGALGIACDFAENASGGFPDDTDAPGPTVVSTATLREVAGWFPGLTLDEARRRFRANLEIDGVEPFWEDRLIDPRKSDVALAIGGVRWMGVRVCQRCAVPSRAADTGEPTPNFQKTFATHRKGALPSWSPREHFDHFYRLAVNTRLAPGQGQTPGSVAIGAPVSLA